MKEIIINGLKKRYAEPSTRYSAVVAIVGLATISHYLTPEQAGYAVTLLAGLIGATPDKQHDS